MKLKHLILMNFVVCAVLAVTSMFTVDQSLAHYFNAHESASLKAFGLFITDIGLAEYYFAIALLTIAFSSLALKKMILSEEGLARLRFFKAWGQNFLVGLLVSGFIVHLFKNLIGRARPHQSPDFYPFLFESFNFSWRWQSMPSGHSQVMFTAATFFALAFPRLKYLWFAFALLICFSRVMVHDHFLSDTIMGAYTGWLGATLTLYYFRDRSWGLGVEPQKEIRKPSASV